MPSGRRKIAVDDTLSSGSKVALAALANAIAVIEQGMGGFLQISIAAMLKKIVMVDDELMEVDRQDVYASLISTPWGT